MKPRADLVHCESAVPKPPSSNPERTLADPGAGESRRRVPRHNTTARSRRGDDRHSDTAARVRALKGRRRGRAQRGRKVARLEVECNWTRRMRGKCAGERAVERKSRGARGQLCNAWSDGEREKRARVRERSRRRTYRGTTRQHAATEATIGRSHNGPLSHPTSYRSTHRCKHAA